MSANHHEAEAYETASEYRAYGEGFNFRVSETHPTGNMPVPEYVDGLPVTTLTNSPLLDAWEAGYSAADDGISRR